MTYPNDPNGDPARRSPSPYGSPNPYGTPPPESPSTAGPYYSGPGELYPQPQPGQQYPPLGSYVPPGAAPPDHGQSGYQQPGYGQQPGHQQAPYPGPPGYVPPQYNSTPPGQGGGNNNTLIIIGAVVAVLAIVAVVLTVVLVSGDDSDSSNDASSPATVAEQTTPDYSTPDETPEESLPTTADTPDGTIAFAVGPVLEVTGDSFVVDDIARGRTTIKIVATTNFISSAGTARVPVTVGVRAAVSGTRDSSGALVATTLILNN